MHAGWRWLGLTLVLAAPAGAQPAPTPASPAPTAPGVAPPPPPGAVAPAQPAPYGQPPPGYWQPAPAYGQPPPVAPAPSADPWASRFALLGHIGIGTPVGFLGVGAEAAAARWLVVEAGAGLGPAGPEVAGLVRLRGTFWRTTAMGLGTGVSAGNYEWVEGPFVDNPAAKRARPAYFANVELVFEHRTEGTSGFQMRELLGYAFILNPGSLECYQEVTHCQNDHQDNGKRVFFLGMSFGYFF